MNCPLCNKHLLDVGFGDVICQTRIRFDDKATLSHYEKREGKVYWYIPPYQIISLENETHVMKADEEDKTDSDATAGSVSPPNFKKVVARGFYSQPNFKKVFTMNEHFAPTEPERLLKRIKLLTLFS